MRGAPVVSTDVQQHARTYRNDPGSCTHGANIQHENLSFAELLYLALLLATLQMEGKHQDEDHMLQPRQQVCCMCHPVAMTVCLAIIMRQHAGHPIPRDGSFNMS